MYNPSVNSLRAPHRLWRQQAGSSLVELMVGVAIGLMVVTAAIGTLVLSRATSRGVNDQLELQQQANMAMRIMATYLRQNNSREVLVDGTATFFSTPQTFLPAGTTAIQPFVRTGAVPGDDDVGVVFADIGPINPAGSPLYVQEGTPDCLGVLNAAPVVAGPVTSRFYVDNNRLMCVGVNAVNPGPQALISDVQRFRARYLVSTGSDVATTAQYFTQATLPVLGLPNNNGIVGVELCLELASAPRAGFVPPPGTYTDCDGNQVNHDSRARAVVRQSVRLRAVPVV